MPITFNVRHKSFYPLYNDHIKLPEDFWQYAERHNTAALEFAYIDEAEWMRIIGIMSCLRARKFTFLCGIGGREYTTTK